MTRMTGVFFFVFLGCASFSERTPRSVRIEGDLIEPETWIALGNSRAEEELLERGFSRAVLSKAKRAWLPLSVRVERDSIVEDRFHAAVRVSPSALVGMGPRSCGFARTRSARADEGPLDLVYWSEVSGNPWAFFRSSASAPENILELSDDPPGGILIGLLDPRLTGWTLAASPIPVAMRVSGDDLDPIAGAFFEDAAVGAPLIDENGRLAGFVGSPSVDQEGHGPWRGEFVPVSLLKEKLVRLLR